MIDAPWRPTPTLAMGLGKILAAQTTGRLHLVHSLLMSLKGSTMIMLLTQDSELREQLTEALQQSGHKVAIPAHRENILTMLEDSRPSLIILDLHVSHPSGPEDLKMIRDRGYVERTIVLSSPPMISALTESHANGVDRVLKVPVKINGRYDLGELRAAVKWCLQNRATSARPAAHGAIAQRAYELYEAGDRHEGSNLQHWLQAERDITMRQQ